MALGLDDITDPPIAALKAAGFTFLCRYTGYFAGYNDAQPQTQQGKCLTPEEAKALSMAGMTIVSNYEWYETRPTEGYAAGVWDAQEAQKIHLACGGPANRPIYFSVDFDAAGPDVLDYFHGVSSVIGLIRTGVYGSYRVLAYLFDQGAIAWGWQTYAWSGGAWEPRAHIQQYSNGMIMSGLSVDYDRSLKADFGQWIEGGSMVPQGWTDTNNVLTAPNGVKVVHGFRDYVLNNAWPAENYPLAPEFATGQLELSNTALGAGTQQIFRWSMLGWTQSHGVLFEWTGQELAAVRQQVQKYAAQLQQDKTQIAQLQAELAKATTPTGVDPATVKDRLTAIGLAANNGNTAVQQLVNQPFS